MKGFDIHYQEVFLVSLLSSINTLFQVSLISTLILFCIFWIYFALFLDPKVETYRFYVFFFYYMHSISCTSILIFKFLLRFLLWPMCYLEMCLISMCFGDFPDIFLLLISGLIPVWSVLVNVTYITEENFRLF